MKGLLRADRVLDNTRSLTQRSSVVVLGVLVTLVTTFLTMAVSLQTAAFIVLFFAMIATFNRAAMLGAIVVLTLFVPLLRRLISGGSSPDSDPLAILLVVAIAALLLASLRKALRARPAIRVFHLGATSVLLSIAVSVAASGPTTEGAFGALAVVACLGLTSAIGARVVPDVWPFIQKALPMLGVISGVYGVFQFYFLPGWDRAWMLNSGLRSIGQAIPMQVRVFGPSEAPGPYAFVLGLCVTIAAGRALMTPGKTRVTSIAAAAIILFPMLLTGVRTAVIAVVVALFAILILRVRGSARLALVFFLAILLAALTFVQGRLSGTSALFSGSRYGQFNAATDTSLQERLAILSLLREPARFLVGNFSGQRYDNVVIDLLVNFGILAAVGVLVGLVSVAVAAIANLRADRNPVAAAATLFCLVTAASGNIYLSGFGILASVAFGSTLSSWWSSRATNASSRHDLMAGRLETR